MLGEVISIGDELTSGERLDTNTQWLSRRLTEVGVRIGYHTTVADDLEACTRAFQLAIERADIVISSGGLGPTADDLTRDALAAATGTTLHLNEAVMDHIRSIFARRGRMMPARNEVQAMFPEGSRLIPNPHGTAPGILMELARSGRGPCRWYALPGVPAELFEMWEQTVSAEVASATGRASVIRHRSVKCFGVGESHLEQMLPDIIRRGRLPSVGITVHEGTITLRITAEGETEESCLLSMEPTIATIRECLGSLVFGSGEDELEDAVGRLLSQRQQTLATVEWGTAGQIARWLAGKEELRPWYLGGLSVPGPQAAAKLLNISAETWTDKGASTAIAAETLAAALREQTGADIVLAVSDVPPLAALGTEPESYYVALAFPDRTLSRGFPYAAHPAIAQSLAAKRALNYLRLTLEDAE